MNFKTGFTGFVLACGLWAAAICWADSTDSSSTPPPASAPADTQPASRPTPATTEAATTEPSSQPAAPKLAGTTFLSVSKHEVGMPPPGGASPMGNWRLRFTDKEVHWQHSDMVELMTYTVSSDGTITANRRAGLTGKPIVAKYDPQKKQVQWEGEWYKAKP